MIKRSNFQDLGSVSPKQGLQSTKSKVRQVKDLENEVEMSKIAIENINANKVNDHHLSRKIQQLQKELQTCIVMMNSETKKHSSLSELIVLLKGEMNKVQAVQKNEEELEYSTYEKKIKKIEYDLKQILHKHNEEIAKINSMKAAANAARDERVVYSNLFKKIEKEIKHYEEIYKDTLIKNQIHLDQQKANSWLKSETQETDENTRSSYNCTEKVLSGLEENGEKMSMKKSVKNDTSRDHRRSINFLSEKEDTFLTNVKDKNSRTYEGEVKHEMNQTTSSIYKTMRASMKKKEAEIEILAIKIGCKNAQEILKIHSNINRQSAFLISEIEQIVQKIEEHENEIQGLRLQKRTSQIYENAQLPEFISSRKFRSGKHVASNPTEEEEIQDGQLLENIILSMAEEFGLQMEDNQSLTHQDFLTRIADKVDYFEKKSEKFNKKQSKLTSSEDIGGVNEKAMVELLEKASKVNDNERIFDKNLFKLEYQRQINKGKSKNKHKNK